MLNKNIILLGPPGSGKGTQATFIAKEYNLYIFGVGNLMRQEASAGTAIGKQFQAVWNSGQGGLVSDDLVNEFVYNKLKELGQDRDYLFDGYPRTVKQAENLNLFLKGGLENTIVINIEVPSEELVKRMSTRRVCEKCGKVFFEAERRKLTECDACKGKLILRQEDQPDVIKKRIAVYESQTKPLIEYYKNQDVLISIDGRPAINKVTAEIRQKLKEALS